MPDNFVQDPYDTQNYNRYSYVLNNPLSYTDQSGEFIPLLVIAIGALIGAATGAAAYIASSIKSGSWNWGSFGLSILGGAILGAVSAGQLPASIGIAYVASTVGTGFVVGLLPSANFSIGNWDFSISPAIAFGKGISIGANFSVGFNDGNFSISGGYGISYNGNYLGTGKGGFESRKSILGNWDDGHSGLSLGTNFWNGSNDMAEFKQQTGVFKFRDGDFGFNYENDGNPFGFMGLGDNGDRYRTAALGLSIKDFKLGVNIFTGERTDFTDSNTGMRDSQGFKMRWGMAEAGSLRFSPVYFQYKNFRVGANSEHIRQGVQNWFAHSFLTHQRSIPSLSRGWSGYFQY
jgi:hypothetical protein